MIRLRFSLAAVALAMIVPLIAFAEAEDKPAPERWFIGPRIGVSPYTGMLGLEIQREHVSVGIGLFSPSSLFGVGHNYGLRYYLTPQKHSWYLGACTLQFKEEVSGYFDDTPETHEGIEKDYTAIGFGGGHRWRWWSGLDASFGVVAAYRRVEAKGFTTGQKNTENDVWLIPEVAIGYSF